MLQWSRGGADDPPSLPRPGRHRSIQLGWTSEQKGRAGTDGEHPKEKAIEQHADEQVCQERGWRLGEVSVEGGDLASEKGSEGGEGGAHGPRRVGAEAESSQKAEASG